MAVELGTRGEMVVVGLGNGKWEMGELLFLGLGLMYGDIVFTDDENYLI